MVPTESILLGVITMLSGAVGTVWALYARAQSGRLTDYQERVKRYDEQVLPALQSVERALVKLTDLYERQELERRTR